MKLFPRLLLLVSVAFITVIDNSAFAQDKDQTTRQISDSRKLISFPMPFYTEKDTGTVIVNIQVNRKGFVTKTQIDTLKSTTSNITLLDNALKAARTARFSKIDTNIIETGQLTYHFKQK